MLFMQYACARTIDIQQIPAVCHVDGSSRIQTLNRADNALYHHLITAFYKLTGVPMVSALL
jgi:carbamoyltransferase